MSLQIFIRQLSVWKPPKWGPHELSHSSFHTCQPLAPCFFASRREMETERVISIVGNDAQPQPYRQRWAQQAPGEMKILTSTSLCPNVDSRNPPIIIIIIIIIKLNLGDPEFDEK